MKTSIAGMLFVILAGTLALAQDRPTVTAQPNTVFVSADGKFEANPDTALVQFNISAQEESSRAAYDRASKAAEQIRQILRSNGIEPKAAEIGFFSLQPVYDFRTAKRKLVGYRVNTNVSLKLKDFSKIAPIVQQLADTDITENQTVSYTLDDIDAAKTHAVEDAYRRARESGFCHSRLTSALAYCAGSAGVPLTLIWRMNSSLLAVSAAGTVAYARSLLNFWPSCVAHHSMRVRAIALAVSDWFL